MDVFISIFLFIFFPLKAFNTRFLTYICQLKSIKSIKKMIDYVLRAFNWITYILNKVKKVDAKLFIPF